jgi:hypothetical protein
MLATVILPRLLFLPLLLPGALTWRDPRRIVVFRRFKTRERNRALRHIATRHLGRYGHVFTLADQEIHRSWFVRIPALFGQLSFLHFRPHNVTSERRLAALKQLLGRRAWLNLNWLVDLRKIFPIRLSDDYWQACVKALLDDADVVVMEVSNFSAALSWELHECERRGLLNRIILLAEREHAEPARTQLSGVFAGRSEPFERALFTYRGAELANPDALRLRIADICRQPLARLWQQSTMQTLLSGLITLVTSLALATGAVAVSAPYVWPYQTAHYSPVKSQVTTAYFVDGDPAFLSRIVATDREWTLTRLRQELARASSRSHYAANAVRDLGHERDIALLVQYLGDTAPQASNDADLGWFRWFTVRNISRRVDEESLLRLAQRLGERALEPLVTALAAVPKLPLDGSLYLEYVDKQAEHVPAGKLRGSIQYDARAPHFGFGVGTMHQHSLLLPVPFPRHPAAEKRSRRPRPSTDRSERGHNAAWSMPGNVREWRR